VGVHHALIATPSWNAYPIATSLHDHCAIYAPPPPLTPPFHVIPYVILVIAISCKGQRQGAALSLSDTIDYSYDETAR